MKIELDSMSTRILIPVFGIIALLIGMQTWNAWKNAKSEKERLIEGISAGHERLMNEAQLIAKENLDITVEKYRIGIIPTIEFRTAQLNYINAKVRNSNAKYQAKVSEIILKQLAGSLQI